MNAKSSKKLEDFLSEKMRNILDETREDKPVLDTSYIKTKGFETSNLQSGTWGVCYEFSNSNEVRCFFYPKREQKNGNRDIVQIKIDDVSSSGWYGTVSMLYRCMDEIEEIAQEFRKLKSELEKQEKINTIAKNSIKTWLKAILQNQPYSYYTTETENKVMLSIKLKNRMQLDIPIYYNRFQKIMPELLNTIQQFEKTANESKIKVLIANTQPNQEWKTSIS